MVRTNRLIGLRVWTAICCAMGVGVQSAAWADTFILQDGGRIEGEWLNPSEPAPDQYEIRLDSGATLVLEKQRVKHVVPTSPEKRSYRKWLQKMKATAEDNWKMAAWCAKYALKEERDFHLRETVRLDPNHADARRLLGYQHVEGDWVLADDLMAARGLVKHKGRWRLPHDLDRLARAEAAAEKTGEWKRQIRIWRRWLGTARDAEATEKLLAIRDPLAAPIIAELLAEEDLGTVQRLWIRILAQIPSGVTAAALTQVALQSPDQELATYALEHLKQLGFPGVQVAFIQALDSRDNARVCRGGLGLQYVGDETAIKPLIRALVTKHRKVVSPANSNEINTIFGSGPTTGSGFSTGSRPQVVSQFFSNVEVLDALRQLTGVNYQFDQDAWMEWYIQQRSPTDDINLRRHSPQPAAG